LNPDKYPTADKVWVVEEAIKDYLTEYDEDSLDIINSWIEPEKPIESTEPSESTEPTTPTEPSTPTNSSDRPKLPDTKNPTKKAQTTTRKKFPQTGEVYRGFFTVLGLIILALVAVIHWKRRNAQK